MSNVQKFLANEGGIHKRRLDIRPIPSATFSGIRKAVVSGKMLPRLARPELPPCAAGTELPAINPPPYSTE